VISIAQSITQEAVSYLEHGSGTQWRKRIVQGGGLAMNQENDAMRSIIAFTGAETRNIVGDYAANAADRLRARSSETQSGVKNALERGEEPRI
jgi:hypothetical protein